jgi:signal transduction histidine kinase
MPEVLSSRSLVRQLQIGFGLATLLVLGGFAAVMDVALHRSLEKEDALVLEAQATYLARVLAEGRSPGEDPGARPEKAEWELSRDGQPPRRSSGFLLQPAPRWAEIPPDGRTHEVELPGGGEVSVLRRLVPGGELHLLMDRRHEGALIASFRQVLWAGTGLAAVLAALLGRLVATRSLRPLRVIAEETAAVRPGNPFHPLEAARFPRELEQLVTTLNAALARLQSAIVRLEELGGELAHELRTPLQHLRSSLEDLALGRTSIEPQALGPSLEACDRLQSLIEGILFLARSEDPTASLHWAQVDVAPLLEATRDFFEGVAEEAGVHLEVAGPPGLQVPGDAVLLQRALHNLVSNALAATPAGRSIRLEAALQGGEVLLCVVDEGRGIPDPVRANLGGRWNRGSESRGHGLGLAIVASIAALHGGRFTLESGGPLGTCAVLRLPGQRHLKNV